MENGSCDGKLKKEGGTGLTGWRVWGKSEDSPESPPHSRDRTEKDPPAIIMFWKTTTKCSGRCTFVSSSVPPPPWNPAIRSARRCARPLQVQYALARPPVARWPSTEPQQLRLHFPSMDADGMISGALFCRRLIQLAQDDKSCTRPPPKCHPPVGAGPDEEAQNEAVG